MKIAAVTACPSGVAHTYMSAEALQVAAKDQGYECHVETQGQIGIENRLDPQYIKDCDVVILTNDIGIKDEDRFKGKLVLRVKAGALIKQSSPILHKLAEKLGC
ncbi:PTS fructose-like transporter subunit IIB [Ligilactobacillus saerimneri]|uniref:PTS fructose-like transporter subunit IIB n=1 Tax=Ligilactobacillus saerimneri TaxID=228229 RepID=UPI001C104618|nr:PTS fructose-like transporter subunit IIB [Ligilactobacillus saerimneri]MBU5309715.1 PTS fructose-like transporter subunit IIB [Ligilactobacillus saerimneri]